MFLRNGTPVTSAQVGETVTFDVAGHTQVWLYQLKDGQQQFNGPFSVPMAPYTFTQNDIGHYQWYVYEMVGSTFGALIASGTMDVVAAGSAVGGLTTSNLLLYGGLAVGAYLLLGRRR